MQNNIDKREIKLLNQISYTMAKTTSFLVLVLLVATILNGYSVEGAGRGYQPEKEDPWPVYKSQKATQPLWMQSFYNICLRCEIDHAACPDDYFKYLCPNNDLQTTAPKIDNSKAKNLP
jgi:hypothetical protein